MVQQPQKKGTWTENWQGRFITQLLVRKYIFFSLTSSILLKYYEFGIKNIGHILITVCDLQINFFFAEY